MTADVELNPLEIKILQKLYDGINSGVNCFTKEELMSTTIYLSELNEALSFLVRTGCIVKVYQHPRNMFSLNTENNYIKENYPIKGCNIKDVESIEIKINKSHCLKTINYYKRKIGTIESVTVGKIDSIFNVNEKPLLIKLEETIQEISERMN